MRVTHTGDTWSAESLLGEQVRMARELRGWSQESLARHLREFKGIDLHQSAIARLESGKRTIRFGEAAAIAQLLELDLRVYSGFGTTVTDEEYEAVKIQAADQADMIEVMERELSELRDRQDAEQISAISRLSIARNRLAALRAGIHDYEERRGNDSPG